LRWKFQYTYSSGTGGNLTFTIGGVTITSLGLTASSIAGWYEIDVTVAALSGAGSAISHVMFVNDTGDAVTSTIVSDTIDWTQDNDFAFALVAGATSTMLIRGVTIEIVGGV
jgi:hypothetical protein